MKSIKILVAEDDLNIREGLVDTLVSEGYVVKAAQNGEEALNLFKNEHFDLAFLDIMMPEQSGYEVCKKIRSKNEDIPIIMLTAKSEEIDKVVGLQLGADDYITKPFGVHELLARVSAVLRRSKRNSSPRGKDQDTPDKFKFGIAEINTREFKARSKGKMVGLSIKEVHLLSLFYAHPHAVLSRDQLLETVWGTSYEGTTRTLDQHIAQLRKKVEPNTDKPSVITTVHGVGYRYEG